MSEAPVEVKPEPKYRMPTGERLMTDTERQQKVFLHVVVMKMIYDLLVFE